MSKNTFGGRNPHLITVKQPELSRRSFLKMLTLGLTALALPEVFIPKKTSSSIVKLSSVEAGYIYCPYIPLMSSGVIVDSETSQRHVSFMTRYDI